MASGLALLSLAGVAGCGGGEADTASAAITTETFCEDFMLRPTEERRDAAIRLSTELAVPQAGTAQWAPMLEARCTQAPMLKLGDFFNHFK